jgi:hypothetical protein
LALTGTMLLGIFVSLHPDRLWVKQRRAGIAVIFAALGIVGALIASIQGWRANQETFGIQGQLAATRQHSSSQATELDRVRAEAVQAREELARARKLNADLQQRLLDQSSEMKELALKRIAEATGGDGFAYLDVAPHETGVGLQAHVNGSNRLKQVKYRIAGGELVDLGDLAPSSSAPLDTVLHPSRESASRYQITILAANGPVQEDLELRFNPSGQRWERRVRVSRGGELLLERGWGH